MDKSEFLSLLSKRASISYEEARLFYDKFITRFAKAIKSGQNVRISGFGEFRRKIKKGKRVFDPKTGLEKVIPSKVIVGFIPAKIFADKINIRYRNLKSVVVKAQPPVVEEKETDEFKLTFFEAEKKADGVKSEIVFGEYEPIVEPIQALKAQPEDYLILPEKPILEGKIEAIDVDVPIFDVFQRVDVSEVNWGKDIEELEKVKINFEEVAMPEFNLTEEPKQPQGKGEAKKIFDDTQKKEAPAMAFEYEEENQKRTGFWVFLLVVFLIFIGGVVFLLNQYGYIHLGGKGKEASKVEFKQPEEVIVTTPPEIKPTPEAPATVEEKKPEQVVTVKPPKVSKPAPREGRSYIIQVASFQDKKLADAFASNLRSKGYNAFVERAFVEWKGGNWYRVRVGFFDSIERANEVAEKLKRDAKVERVWISEATRGVVK